MDFTAIDFETANGKLTSACSLGIAVVKNSRIVKTGYWLFRPQPFEFNYFNILITGLNEEKLRDKPLFCECWDEIKPYVENQFIVAHNAVFDISVLTQTLSFYNIPLPNLQYICTYKASQKVFDNVINYRLDTIANCIGFNFSHHNALEDAQASAKVLLYIAETLECDDIRQLANTLGLRLGKLSNLDHITCAYVRNKPKCRPTKPSPPLAKRIVATTTDFDTDNEFYGKSVAFTGALKCMSRAQAYQAVANLGGKPSDNVTKTTDYLVVGVHDYRLLKGHNLSSKTRKAIKYAKEGTGIQIISEEDFYKLLGSGCNE